MIKLNGVEIKPTIFPDGTSQVWQLDKELFDTDKFNIRWDFENEAELFHICQLSDLLVEMNCMARQVLTMPYLPYGRQDKKISNDSTFALTTFTYILEKCTHLDEVRTLDAHSGVLDQLLWTSDIYYVNKYPEKEINYAVEKSECDVLAFPDKGASIRYTNVLSNEPIIGDKVRNQLTGYIEKYTLEGDALNKNVLIIDDIACGGMTFKLMAEELYKQGAKSVHLYITHGIFSKGIKTLRDSGIKRIFTKNGEVE